MIRVLHYGLSPNLGGIETYLWNLFRTADPARFHFDFLFSDTGRPPAFTAEFRSAGSLFHGVTPRRVSVRRNRQELASVVTPEHADILHFHANTASYMAPVRAALRSGVPVIVHSHNAGASSSLTRVLHRVNRLAFHWGEVTGVAVSDEAGQWMFDGGARYHVVPNGISVESFAFRPETRDAVRRSLGVEGRFVIGHIGTFLPAKNHDLLLSIFREVHTRLPTAVLVLVGTGPLEQAVRAQVRELGLGDAVKLLGRRTDVPDLLTAIDCLLLPSRHEGFGLVVLEAQASGLPCVVSDAVPQAVAVLPSTERLSVKASLDAWADAVTGAASLGDRDTAPALLRSAGYSVEANTAAIEEIYDRLTSAAPV